MSEQTVEQRLAALEKDVEVLHEGYKDVAYTLSDSLVKRIEEIRDELNATLDEAVKEIDADSREKIAKVVEEARQKLSHDAIVDAVIPELTSGRHTLVTRPASFEEQRSGKGVPVRQAPHKG